MTTSLGSFTARAKTIDAATPADRNRVIDFLRAAAITVVVLGHWTIVAAYLNPADAGRVGLAQVILPHGVLDAARWIHPLTWVCQVMPVFFLVGGYANALSWRSARRRQTGYPAWLRARLRRLGLPLMPLLLVWLVVCGGLALAGVPLTDLQIASQVALIPTWFLAAYLGVILLAPLGLAAWERFGWGSVVAGIALAGVVDAVSIGLDAPLLGYPNYVLVWASFHQVGFAWLDGRLTGLRRRWTLAGIGAVGLAVLVGFGPYPVSMITAAGDAISNSSPTRVTMAFLGLLQTGLVLSLEAPLRRALATPTLWLITVIINRRIMTWFLWHLTAMVGLTVALWLLGGIGLHLVPLTGLWWATRPVWCLALLLITAGLVAVFGRFEDPRPDPRPAPPVWQPLLAALTVCAGLAVLAGAGIVDADGVNWLWPLLPVLGMTLFGVLRWPRRVKHAA